MLDLRGPELAADEREILRHPLVGGVILFSRNYSDPGQLRSLTESIHGLRHPALLIAVDHEGGRVQRFHQGFSRLPACACFGNLFDNDRREGLERAEEAGWLMAAELLSAGVDFSFAPVLDLDLGISQVIGDRAFHRQAEAVADLARQYCLGMKRAGMAAIGKHFPGHGSVREDSHHDVPRDTRALQEIMKKDIIPFQRLVHSHLQGIMPAHVIYTDVDALPAGFSSRWLQGILRQQFGFQGAIFSDDISMAGAEVLGSYTSRTRAALAAGCDMVLVCNNQAEAVKILETLDHEPAPASQVRLIRLHGRGHYRNFQELQAAPNWQQAATRIASLEQAPELELDDDGVPG